jgi:phosphatidyl-myo-inositol dimannoside synthase
LNQKVLVLSKGIHPTPGGLERYAFEVVSAYARNGCEVTLITQGKVAPSFLVRNVTVYICRPGPQLVVAIKMLAVYLRLLWFRKEKFRFVHATTWRTGVLPLLLCSRNYVITAHGNEFLKKNRLQAIIMGLTYRFAKNIYAVSAYSMDKLVECCPDASSTVKVNYNGTSFGNDGDSTIRKSVEDELRILCVCRLETRKNVTGALKGVALALDQGAKLHFDIVGSGPEEGRIREVSSSLGITASVSLHGRVADTELRRFYKESHVFLHPQKEQAASGDVEGFGLVIVDAMVFGSVPIVGSNGGSKELFVDSRDGFYVDPEDFDQIASYIYMLWRNKERYLKLSENAKAKAKDYDWNCHVRAILEENLNE